MFYYVNTILGVTLLVVFFMIMTLSYLENAIILNIMMHQKKLSLGEIMYDVNNIVNHRGKTNTFKNRERILYFMLYLSGPIIVIATILLIKTESINEVFYPLWGVTSFAYVILAIAFAWNLKKYYNYEYK